MSICLAITDADWALTKDVFSVIGTVVSAIGVGLAAWVGFSGLATWRRQNKGTSDHDLSRRLLMDIYRLRDGIGHVRNPVMFGSEGGAEEQGQNLNFQQINYRATVRAYQKRFAMVDEVRARLDTSLVESEAVWDGEVKSRFAVIFKLQHELVINVRSYLITMNPDEKDDTVQAYVKILAKRRDVLYESPLEGEDIFKTELDAALSMIEDYLRPKLIK
ncbi:hypothetical protein [Pseudomonas paraveronii]|uniref:hypothetical protein n=1 Tax=Pseudomonas paraveronii TaxID=3040598 RepID=UPI002AB1D815|nr:hypothetical protein [Pseudomonas sp. FLM 11]